MSKYKTKDDEIEIIPDGGTVRVSILAMDSTQKQIAALDERAIDTIKANQSNLAAAQRTADQVQAHADHFSEQQQVDDSAYARHCRELSDAWQQVSA